MMHGRTLPGPAVSHMRRRSGEGRPAGKSPVLKSGEESEIERFVAAVDGVGDPADVEDALRAVQVAEAALKSAKTGKAERP